jgi:DNA (cytosine-5)-methyltransferase 1
MNAIDLFAGCGGLSKGFMDAGFDIIVGVDNDQAALNTFAKNHNGAKPLLADLSKQETFDEIVKIAGNRSIDVIIAGPPCQGFSLTGPRNFDDPRNKLYLAVLEMVRQYKPKGFIIENVPGMATMYNGQVKDEVLRRFEAMGYNVKCQILCAADYGVPQIRKRLVYMGIRSDIGIPEFPKPILTPENYITCRDALSDLPPRTEELGTEIDVYRTAPKTAYQKLMRGSCNILSNHVATKHKQFVIDTISQVPEGGNWRDLPEGVGSSRNFNEAWTRYDGNKPSRTIDTGHRNHFHYEYNRVPTIRENARLQSFPDDFVFTGTKTQQNRQVGNAVPPLLGYHLGKALGQILTKKKIKTIDLFAGCGGLTEGFAQTGLYETKACVEWEIPQCQNLTKRLLDKWEISDANQRVIRFDIQRTDELIHGFSDPDYGESVGLDALVGDNLDLVIGGPPCQAYSLAGRIRDENGMKNDYRNYLFESYLEVVVHFQPKAFVFENVPGLLSAKPTGTPIVELIQKQFAEAGYEIIPNLKDAVIDVSDYGVAQVRKRVIILGLSKKQYGAQAKDLLNKFYTEILPKNKSIRKKTLRETIGDLPALYPTKSVLTSNKIRTAHSLHDSPITNHEARYQNARDIDIFSLLAKDIESGENKYVSIEARKELYTKLTGKTSNIHKYNVLRWDEPSTTIPAHLCKDGLRHIHPDSKQARTITVREAARLQSFPDDYEFIGAMTDQFRMIGNAVPPEFARRLALSVYELLFDQTTVN